MCVCPRTLSRLARSCWRWCPLATAVVPTCTAPCCALPDTVALAALGPAVLFRDCAALPDPYLCHSPPPPRAGLWRVVGRAPRRPPSCSHHRGPRPARGRRGRPPLLLRRHTRPQPAADEHCAARLEPEVGVEHDLVRCRGGHACATLRSLLTAAVRRSDVTKATASWNGLLEISVWDRSKFASGEDFAGRAFIRPPFLDEVRVRACCRRLRLAPIAAWQLSERA